MIRRILRVLFRPHRRACLDARRNRYHPAGQSGVDSQWALRAQEQLHRNGTREHDWLTKLRLRSAA